MNSHPRGRSCRVGRIKGGAGAQSGGGGVGFRCSSPGRSTRKVRAKGDREANIWRVDASFPTTNGPGDL